MKDWWLNLNLREKQTIAWGGVAIILILLYLFAWSPLMESVTMLRNKVQRNQKLLVWMKAANEQIQSARLVPNKKSTTGSLLSIVQNQVNSSSVAKNVTQLRQTDNDAVQLNFQNVDFDRLMKWLVAMAQEEGLLIAQMSVTPTDAPGVVNATCMLKA
jgi:general secretion pathway protein M